MEPTRCYEIKRSEESLRCLNLQVMPQSHSGIDPFGLNYGEGLHPWMRPFFNESKTVADVGRVLPLLANYGKQGAPGISYISPLLHCRIE
jgi:hypothetical protein